MKYPAQPNFPQALNCTISEEGDPVFSCVFKTELTTHLLQLTQASINVLIGPAYVFRLTLLATDA